MDEKRPFLIASEQNNKSPLLIIDKQGILGKTFSAMLREQFLVVLVSGLGEVKENIIHISFRRKIPVIPDNHYAQMFVFYNGEEEVLDMLPALVKKANETNSKLLFITPLLYFNSALHKRFANHLYHNMQIIVYGEIFDHHALAPNIVSSFLQQTKKYGRLIIPNDGVGNLYPIFIDDVFTAIIATAFGSEKKKLTLVFPKHAVSELSIARMLQKQNPLLKLDLKKDREVKQEYFIPQEGDYYYPDYPLEQKLKETQGKVEFKEEKRKKQTVALLKVKRDIKPNVFWLVLLGLILGPILTTFFVAVIGFVSLQLSINQIEKGQLVSAINTAEVASLSFKTAENIGISLFYLDPFVKAQKDYVLRKLAVSRSLSEVEVAILRSVSLMKEIADNKSKDPKNDFLQGLATLKNSLVILQKMRVDGDLPEAVRAKLSSLEPVLLPFESTIDTLPTIFGLEGKKQYLVLFQNNMELRPGGGFIGSYALLKIERGRVSDFKVYDVYDADGKLTIHVEPPVELQRYLGSRHWFLRDSNFAVDFPTNAQQAKNFLELETGEKVDGVIGIDITFLKNILSAVGSVEVADYKETVTADNFYLLTQNHAERDFFPGSTQKKDFLSSLLTSLQNKFVVGKEVNYKLLAKKIGESMLAKDLIFVFFDGATQEVFKVNNLSASLWDNRSSKDNTLLDYLGVVDANLGANKVNYYLTRSLDQKAVLNSRGTLQTTTTITYANMSKKDSPYSGDYKNYVRFVLPKGSVLKEIKINDVAQQTIDAVTDPAVFTAKNFTIPKELEVVKSDEQGKEVVGFLVLVPRGQTRKITLVYEKEAVDLNKTTFTYDLRVFKQPGTKDDLYSYSLSYPSTYRAVKLDKALSDVGGKLIYSDFLNKDISLRAEFSKK